MIENLGESGKIVIAYARRIAANLNADTVGTEHLFLGVGDLEDSAIQKALLEAGLDMDEACARIRKKVPSGTGSGGGELPFSAESEAALEEAQRAAAQLGEREVEAPHILIGLLTEEDGLVSRVLKEVGTDKDALKQGLSGMLESGEATPSEFFKTRHNVEQVDLGKSAKLLESLGRDLTEAAEKGELNPIIGRHHEIDQVVKILLGKRKNNAVLLGDAGVGKTAIVEGLAQRIVAHEIPALDGMRVRTVEIGSLVAGTQYRGSFEQKLKDLIDGVRDRNDMILFIDEMHQLIGAGTAEHQIMGAADMLKPVLTEGKLKVIGATTTDEYRKYIERDAALARRFQTVTIGEPSREATLSILTGLRPKYEEFHVVKISDDALGAAVELSVQFIHDRFLPDKAIDLIDKACTQKRMDVGK